MIMAIYKFTILDQIYFTQRLSILLDSNLSMLDSLRIIKSMETSKFKIDIYNNLIADCERGVSLSKSILNLSVKFDSFLITLIKNGEQTGSLVNSLLQVSKNLEKRNEIKKRIVGTLIYPAFILFATVGMAVFLVMFIFPKILPLLNSLNIKLPLLTRIVKFIYEFSSQYFIHSSVLLILLIILIKYVYSKVYRIKLIAHKTIFRIPLISNYFVLNTNSNICSIGEILLNSNRSLSDLHVFNREQSRNIIYAQAFDSIYSDSINGISFAQSITKYPGLFNRIMINMCDIGERTGNLSLMMGHCSRIFEQDIDILLKRFSSLMEPVLMILMGVIVGSIALSIILPVYEITNHLSR